MSESIVNKTCIKCKQMKPLTEFHKNCTRLDGLQTCCKVCKRAYGQSPDTKKYQRKYHQTAKCKKYMRSYYETNNGKASRKRTGKQYRLKNPRRIKARSASNHAIRNGTLKTPTAFQCQVCRTKQAEHYHHPSYKPEDYLKIVPVCQSCHVRIHFG